jgi:hypothetical protein
MSSADQAWLKQAVERQIEDLSADVRDTWTTTKQRQRLPNKIIDLTGKRFGRLVVLALHPERSRFGRTRWVCRCDCGSERIVLGNSLRSGRTSGRHCSRFIDLTGKRFGRWRVIALLPERQRNTRERQRHTCWLCRCDCGGESIVRADKLIKGLSKSCGCISKEMFVKRNTKHGLSRSRAYYCWKNMRARCFNPRHRQYPSYGGRGISVCERWLIFENFYADMGEPPPGLSLDRINNDGNYEPGNCRWATVAEQLANRRPRRHSKRRRKRSSSAALQRYLAATRRVHSEAAP